MLVIAAVAIIAVILGAKLYISYRWLKKLEKLFEEDEDDEG